MPSPLLVVFAVQLVIYVSSSLASQKINDGAWALYSLLPASSSDHTAQLKKLRSEVARLQRELAGVSAQDNFAQWARLRREHDKAKEKFDKISKEQQDTRASFDSIVSKVRWLATQGLNFGTNSYFSKEAMYWLPQGWVPYSAEWILSLVKAPLGSISVNVWGYACATVIALVGELILAALAVGKKDKNADKTSKPTLEKPMAAGGDKSKKEL